MYIASPDSAAIQQHVDILTRDFVFWFGSFNFMFAVSNNCSSKRYYWRYSIYLGNPCRKRLPNRYGLRFRAGSTAVDLEKERLKKRQIIAFRATVIADCEPKIPSVLALSTVFYSVYGASSSASYIRLSPVATKSRHISWVCRFSTSVCTLHHQTVVPFGNL